PEAISWSIPIEVTRPPYAPAYLPELAMPLDEEMAQLFRHMRATGKPLASIAGGESPLPSVMQKEFKAQAQLSLTIQPKNAPCYLLGMQQCSTPRAWLPEEERLFQEMGRRLETALNSLMIFHNLRENEQKLEQAQRMARLGYWEVDLVSGLVSQSAELWHIFGLEEQVVSTDLLSWMEIWQKYITPEDFKSNMDILLHSISQNQPFELQMSVTTPQGEQRYAFSRGHATLDSNGNPLRIFGMSQDITKIKETEQALQEREILYRTLFEQASDGVILHDALTGKATAANQAYTNMMECEISDVLGTGIAEGVPSDEVEDSITRWHQILQAGHLSPYERRVITHQGHMKYFEITASTIYDLSSGSPHLIQAVVRDVTHRKQAEEQLQAALQEKEILLKEIHHRVKNNLQVISSLLYLQSLKITEPSMLELFRESRNRVAAMALVHEQLYQSENFARVDFSTYVRALVTSLYESYGVTDTEIPLKIETDGTALDVHTAIPCGLLISEMVSNALKYAFPDGHGQIAISLRSDGKAHHLTVQDSGIGIPEDSVVRAGAMGLQLIERLTLQIGGTLQRSGPPGTMYHIQFPRQSH
ncbi:MAG TPA: histidine kinase dimerization/phosphoacceptor domain -containing protein, partial [Anaerolineales bacterium]|nr:histidine kinase dimerization/phosphoacceptor domain -containing protein [Anaerolineales bacterium]